jgi:DNA (cytosine-5)-methyltransferase 3A
MKVLSLFDGISGGIVALERLGIPVERYVAYEIDKYALKVSEKNYPQIEHCGDVLDGDFTQYKGFDLLLGGSPCQDISFYNRGGKGLSGAKSSLFFQYLRALQEAKPKYFLFENVVGRGKDVITESLGVTPVLIDSAVLTGQKRRRLYWTNIPFEMPEEKNVKLKDILQTAEETKEFSKIENRIKWLNSASGQKAIKKHYVAINPQKAICLTARGDASWECNYVTKKGKLYKLSPIEWERLQTLPDNYTEGISNTQRYKCIGNGWTVDVISHILKGLVE